MEAGGQQQLKMQQRPTVKAAASPLACTAHTHVVRHNIEIKEKERKRETERERVSKRKTFHSVLSIRHSCQTTAKHIDGEKHFIQVFIVVKH